MSSEKHRPCMLPPLPISRLDEPVDALTAFAHSCTLRVYSSL